MNELFLRFEALQRSAAAALKLISSFVFFVCNFRNNEPDSCVNISTDASAHAWELSYVSYVRSRPNQENGENTLTGNSETCRAGQPGRHHEPARLT